MTGRLLGKPSWTLRSLALLVVMATSSLTAGCCTPTQEPVTALVPLPPALPDESADIEARWANGEARYVRDASGLPVKVEVTYRMWIALIRHSRAGWTNYRAARAAGQWDEPR